MKNANNCTTVIGTVISKPELSHRIQTNEFYSFKVSVLRLSNTEDIIPVIIRKQLLDFFENLNGKRVYILGEFRSHNICDSKRRLVLNLFVNKMTLYMDYEEYVNEIFLDGYLCKNPFYRKTPKGREITDILLAVNRPNKKADYIPCVLWGANARHASTLKVGDHLNISGYIQSREYKKWLNESEYEIRTAYEISAQRMEVVNEIQMESQ